LVVQSALVLIHPAHARTAQVLLGAETAAEFEQIVRGTLLWGLPDPDPDPKVKALLTVS
jgi:hypothetical protein